MSGPGHWSDAPPDRIVTMPPCPSLNKLWSRVPGKARGIRSPEYRAWLLVSWLGGAAPVGRRPATIDCRFNVLIEVPISRRDSDNWVKATMDLLEHVGALTNDGNQHELIVRPMPRADVAVALWCLPGMDGVRSRRRPGGGRGGGRAAGAGRMSPVKGKRAALTWKLPA